MLLVIRLPSPFWDPPKYSETNAVITEAGAAIFNAVNRYGTAFGTRTLRRIATSVAAYERMSSSWIACTSRSPRATLTSTMKYTTSVTISRRGTSLVTENMLLNTETKTKIGTAFRPIASGDTRSFSNRKRASRKLIAMPSAAPTRSPINAFRPDTRVASQIRVALARNSAQIADGAGRKYGWKSNTFTAASHSTRNAMPNTTGGHTLATTDREVDLTGPRPPAPVRPPTSGPARPSRAAPPAPQ